MSRLAFAAAALVAGMSFSCSHALVENSGDSGGDDGNHTGSGDGSDPSGDGPHGDGTFHDARSVDATPCTARVVYASFEGVTLSDPDGTSSTTNAKTNTVSWLPGTTAAIPQYAPGANHQAIVDGIVTSLEEALGGFPVAVVTTRPLQTSDYVMVVFGGSAANLGFGSGSNFSGYAGFDCGDEIPSDVAWVKDGMGTQDTIDFAIGGIGLSIGLTGTTDVNDCMCGWGGATCNPSEGACTLSASIQSNTAYCGVTETEPQNEPAAFRKAFCGM